MARDFVIQILLLQAALYAVHCLNNDPRGSNPLHIDPTFARKAGWSKGPMISGLFIHREYLISQPPILYTFTDRISPKFTHWG